MPAYSKNPNPAYNSVGLIQSGVPAYCYGGFNDRTGPSKLAITQVALTTNVATLTVQLLEGNIPVVTAGQPAPLITVMGTQSNSGEFNVTAIAVSAVSINATTGAGTISYALTASNVTATPDTGIAWVPQPETAETLAANTSIPWCLPTQPAELEQGRAIKAVVSFPTLPTAATVNLQEAAVNQDSEYTTLTAVGVVAASAQTTSQVTITGTPGRFYRLQTTGITGSGTVIGKLLA